MENWRAKRGGDGQYQRDFKRKRRLEALNQYGGRCTCCGVDRFEFLTFDHEAGGGGEHRKAIAARGGSFVSWLFANNFPSGIRVLCHNCNSARGYYGRCPHEG